MNHPPRTVQKASPIRGTHVRTEQLGSRAIFSPSLRFLVLPVQRPSLRPSVPFFLGDGPVITLGRANKRE